MKKSIVLILLVLAGTGDALAKHRRRHRRDPDPIALPDGVEDRLITEQISNKHKPQFLNCDNYKPEVVEESDRGTKVIQVFAEDKDGLDQPSGQVSYSIVSTHNKFTIDPQTGWLSTNKIFNRDEPAREKVAHVTVKASDNGRPKLEDVCTLEVMIKDRNDNQPVFDRVNYDVPIAQDTLEGTQIMRVSATDVDEGLNQKITYDLVATRIPADIEYFKWDADTGVVRLNRKLDKPIGYIFELKANATDEGTPPRSTDIDVTLEVRESNNKPPSFREGPGAMFDLSESFNDFSHPIATYKAESNIPNDATVFFQLVNGRTEQTNKDGTFRAIQRQNEPAAVDIYLAKALEYEKVSEYTLTLQVRNNPDLVAEAQLTVKVQDENNQAPIFTNIESGSVLEHEPPHTVVMQVSAVDNDGTFPNNRVTYSIASKNLLDKFAINPDTGVITTLVEFDREQQAVYALTINAEDGAPSALLNNKLPNITPQKFRIAIADKNDNPPYFPQQLYKAEVPEDQDIGSKVIEVRAIDLDTEASVTTYSIPRGNIGLAFRIEEQTGFIRVNKALDYESIKEYNLIVRAWDGQYYNETRVDITVTNVNDMKPVFSRPEYRIEQVEEDTPSYPVFQVQAGDPDREDQSDDQNITYFLDPNSPVAQHFSIDARTGDLRIIEPLDRDLPNGFPQWTMYIFAKDENGTGLENYVEMKIDLVDINDNPPFLNMPNGLVWYENQPAGTVGPLEADDYDTEDNGPPFTFEIDSRANPDIKGFFAVDQAANGTYVLKTLVSFDREKKKQYQIPIKICDHKGLCDVSRLLLTIGDVNDNPMAPGASEIFVYNYEGRAPDTQIGRVFVTDPDDWDLGDKTFAMENYWNYPDFVVNADTGMITMKEGIKLDDEFNKYFIKFKVSDPVHGQTGANSVEATVNITVQKIPKEAVIKSGSVRFLGTPEEFILPDANGVSRRDKFTSFMSKYLNATYVDVFTVMANGKFTDVRFAAHGSPYYRPERLEGTAMKRKTDLERQVGMTIDMIHIDECMFEQKGDCKGDSCVNDLIVENAPVTVMTNKTSFVGVRAYVRPLCGVCAVPTPVVTSCDSKPCLNNGSCENTPTGYRCNCPANNPQFFGPNCEALGASFNGQGWSWHPGLPACGNSHFSMLLKTSHDAGLILYVGPSPNNVVDGVTDYLALELYKGRPKLFINFGTGTKILTLEKRIDDGKEHFLVLRWTNDTVQMELDDKSCSNEISQSRFACFAQASTHDSVNHYLNTNGPLHVGGVSFGSSNLQSMTNTLGVPASDLPEGSGFVGCIRNLTFIGAGRHTYYDLGFPSDGENFQSGCNDEFVQAVVALHFNMNFLIAILVCLAVILIAVIILAVYRRRSGGILRDKDIDCDIRENIINYEDEGGGEGDQTGYDLSVLRMMANGNAPEMVLLPSDNVKKLPPEAAPDIQTFLQTNKDRIDTDPEATPHDDLRHYAYEGDGNSGCGSLSSLNSAASSDDADLEFDYLHNFGPRFKKLADMYGEESDSDADVSSAHPAQVPLPSESWC